MSDPVKAMDEFILDFAHRIAAAREQAVEQALQGGEHGVLETWEAPDKVTFIVHPSVPYGKIYVVDKGAIERTLGRPI